MAKSRLLESHFLLSTEIPEWVVTHVLQCHQLLEGEDSDSLPPPCRYTMYKLQGWGLLGGSQGGGRHSHMADLTAKCSAFFVVKP